MEEEKEVMLAEALLNGTPALLKDTIQALTADVYVIQISKEVREDDLHRFHSLWHSICIELGIKKALLFIPDYCTITPMSIEQLKKAIAILEN